MFGPASEGFRWISLKIGGPVATPSDNFKDIFLAATAPPSEATTPAESGGFDIRGTHPPEIV